MLGKIVRRSLQLGISDSADVWLGGKSTGLHLAAELLQGGEGAPLQTRAGFQEPGLKLLEKSLHGLGHKALAAAVNF